MKRTLLTLAAIVFIAIPVMSAKAEAIVTDSFDYSHMTTAQLVEVINELKAEIRTLKGGNTASACFVSDTTLTLGDGEVSDGLSDDVERLQLFLREKGFFTFSKNTGFFGKITRTAVLSFQTSVGVAQTGEFDAVTREKAHAMTCTKQGKIKPEAAKNGDVKDIYKDAKIKKEDPKSESNTQKVSSVSSITASANGSHITWSTVGTSPQGFKVVWSKNMGATYPTREGDKYNYHSEPSAANSYIDTFKGPGTYYVRVCEYLGGACGTYSNELTVQLQ